MNKPLLCDANILIDYFNAAPTLLATISEFTKGLFVPDIVYAEATPLKDLDPVSFGIILLDTPFEELEVLPGLSIQDSCCLYYAQNGYTCVTNDIKLRKTCIKRECNVLWGLELLLRLNTEGFITKTKALQLAGKMKKENPTLTQKVFNTFETKLIEEVDNKDPSPTRKTMVH
jgi:rRNA-processing protein FCF1